MKILMPANGFTQFGTIRIVCSDSVMAEVLVCRRQFPERHVLEFSKAIADVRNCKSSFFEYMFSSGAKLKIGNEKNRFYIYCYHYAGLDGVQAVEELKLLYKMRAVFKQMQKLESMRTVDRKPREISISISTFFDRVF